MSYTYNFPRPAVTVDIVLFNKIVNELFVLLIERKHQPFINCWAIPGGFVDENESLDNAALRELAEETGVTQVQLKQIYTFGNPGRDPRGHTISVVFAGFFNEANSVKAGDDAKDVQWFPVSNLPELAFDHLSVLNYVLSVFIVD